MMATLYTHITHCSYGADNNSIVVYLFHDRKGTDITAQVQPAVGDELKIYPLNPIEPATLHLITGSKFIDNSYWVLWLEIPDLDRNKFWDEIAAGKGLRGRNANN